MSIRSKLAPGVHLFQHHDRAVDFGDRFGEWNASAHTSRLLMITIHIVCV